MSVQVVNLLRKGGQLTEAYQMATEVLNDEPYNPWAQTSMFWVLRDMCVSIYLPQNNISEINRCLAQMKELLSTMMDDSGVGEKVYINLYKRIQTGADDISKASELSKSDPTAAYGDIKGYISAPMSIDESLHEDLGWIIYRYIKEQITTMESISVRRLLRDYMNLHNERPSMLHSYILNLALKFSRGSADFNFYNFFILWGPENLRYEDFNDGEYNGNNIPSLISRIINTIVDRDSNIDIDKLCESISLSNGEVVDLIREALFWRMYNCGKAGDIRGLFNLLDEYADRYAKYGASHWNSQVLNLAYRYTENEEMGRFVRFFRRWGYENLNVKDWSDERDDKGNVYKSLAIKSAKRCYEYIKNKLTDNDNIIEWLSGYYDLIIEKGSADEWIPRERATLYYRLGEYQQAIGLYKKLILEMSGKYYLWSELADCIVDDNNLKIALLSKSMLLEQNDLFLGDIHISLAELFIADGLRSEALYELNAYKDTRDKQGWKLSAKYGELMKLIGDTNQKVVARKAEYHNYLLLAEEFVYSDIDSVEVTLVSRWKDESGKSRCLFTDGGEVSFQVNANRFFHLRKAELGQVFTVKCHQKIIDKQATPNTLYNRSAIMERDVKYVPLTMNPKANEFWTSLPQLYGYIDYVNEDKKVLLVITQKSKQGFYDYKGTNLNGIKRGDYVTLREFTVKRKDKTELSFANLCKVDKAVALQYFPTCVAVVDSVNTQKELMHYVVGSQLLDGIIYFKDTNLRPNRGDCLKISYCIKTDKAGKKRRINLNVANTTETNTELIRRVSGWLDVKYKSSFDEDSLPDFAFVDGCYVHRSVLIEYDIDSDCQVTADAICDKNGNCNVIKIYK